MQELIHGLRDGRAKVRVESAAGLGALGAEAIESAGWLAVAVRDSEPSVRRAAIDALMEMEIDAQPFVVAAIAEALADPVEEVRDSAEAGVLGIGESGLDSLVEALDRSAGEAMKRLIPTLMKRQDAVDVFARALRHPLVTIRINAALALFQQAVNGIKEAEPLLAKAKSDDVAEVRDAANNALAALEAGSRPPKVFEPDPILIKGFETRALSAKALEKARKKGLIDTERMILALRDGRLFVRSNAARALGALGPAAGTSAGWLALGLRDPLPEMRLAAIEGLRGIEASGIPMVVAGLVRLLSDEDDRVSEAAGDLMASVAGDSVDALLAGLDTDAKTAKKTVLPLILRRDDAAPVLGRALGSPLVTVRSNAALGLFDLASGAGANTDSAQFLQVAQDDPVQEVRDAASNALKMLQEGDGPPEFFEPGPIEIDGFEDRVLTPKELKAARGRIDESRMLLALRDGRDVVRRNACMAIAVLGTDAQQSSGWLALTMRDPVPVVRVAAIKAMSAVTAVPLPMTVGALVKSLQDPDETVSDAAEAVLAELKDAPVDALIAGMDTDPGTARRATLPVILKRKDKRAVLARALAATSVQVRVNASQALFDLARDGDTEAEALLAQAQNDPAAEVRDATKDAIAGLVAGPPKPIVYEPDPVRVAGFETRPLGAKALAKVTEVTSVDRLMRALSDGREVVRRNAAAGLGVFGGAARPALGWLAMALRDPEDMVREAAVRAVTAIGGEPTPLMVRGLVKMLKDSAPEVVDAAQAAIELVAQGAPDALIEGLDTDPLTARRAILRPVYERSDATAVLGKALQHRLPTVRVNAAYGLRDLAERGDADAQAFLTVAEGDPDQSVQDAAAGIDPQSGQAEGPPKYFEPEPIEIDGFEERDLTLEELGDARDWINEARMLFALRDGRPQVRRNACLAITVLGPEAQQSSGWLSLTLRDPVPHVREAAVRAMHAVTPVPLPMTVQALVGVLQDPDERVSDAAEEVLAALTDAPIDALIAGMDTDPGTARRATLPVILKRSDKRAVLARALAVPSIQVRVNASQALAYLAKEGDAEAESLLAQAKNDPAAEVRDATKEAMDDLVAGPPKPMVLEPDPIRVAGFEEKALAGKALAKVAEVASVERLMRALSDGREIVRRNAAAALGVFGSAATPALGWLAMALRDPEAMVREAAIRAITAIGGEPTPLLVRGLVRALNDSAPEVMDAAQDSIEMVANGSPDALIEGLDTDPLTARRAILRHVLKRPDATGVLGKALQHRLPSVRVNAAYGLRDQVETGDADAEAFLTVAEADPEPSVRAAAAGIDPQGGQGDGDDNVLDASPLPAEGFDRDAMTVAELEKIAGELDPELLRHALFEGRHIVRENAARALGVLAAPGAGGDLLLAAKDTVREVRAAAMRALERVPDAADALVEALGLSPATALPILAARSDALDVLERAKSHANPYISHLALLAFDEIKAADEAVDPERLLAVIDLQPVPVDGFDQRPLDDDEAAAAAARDDVEPARLVHSLNDKRVVVRRNAAAVLGAMGEAASSVVGWLAPSLGDVDATVREAAAEALAKIPAVALPLVIRGLVAALSDSEASVVKAARSALEGMSDGPGGALMEGLDSDADTAKAAILPLIHRRPDASGLLGRALQSPRTRVRVNAATGLFERGIKGDDLAEMFLRIAGQDPEPEVRMAAAGIVESDLPPKPPVVTEPEPFPVEGFAERILDWGALEAATAELDRGRMCRALGDGRLVVRANAVRGLALAGEGGDVPTLLLASRDSDGTVREAAEEALGRLPGAGPALIDALLDFPEPALRALIRRKDGLDLLRAGADHDNSRIASMATAALDQIRAAESAADVDVFLAVLEQVPLPSKGFAEGPLSADELGALDTSVERLTRLLSDGRETVRRNAAAALGARGPEAAGAAGWLAVTLRDGDGDVRTEAVRALASVGGASLPLVTASLVRALSDTYDEVREAAADVLETVEGPVVSLLIDALDSDPTEAFDTILPVVWRRKDRSALLAKAVGDGRQQVRVNAAFGLFRHALDGDRVIDAALEAAKGDTDAAVRDSARGGLAWLLGEGKKDQALDADPVPFDGFEDRLLSVADLAGHELSVERLATALSDGRRRVRLNAVRALQALGEAGVDAEAALLRALKDGEHRIRIAALDALSAVGRPAPKKSAPAGPKAAPPVPESVLDGIDLGAEGFDERLLAEEELDEVTLDIDDLAALLDDGRRFVRINAAGALRRRGEAASDAAPSLVGRLRDGDPVVRIGVLRALLAVGGAQDHPAALIAMVRDDRDSTCRDAAAGGLTGDGLIASLVGDPTFVQATMAPLILRSRDTRTLLARAASHPSVVARINAVLCLYRRADGGAVEALLEDPVTEVRSVARAALRGLMRGEARPSHRELVAGLVGRWIPPGFEPDEPESPSEDSDSPEEDVGPLGLPPVTDASPAQLAILIRDTDPEVRREAAIAIGDGPAAADLTAVARLAAAVDDPEEEVRDAARVAVAAATRDALVAALAGSGETFAEVIADRVDGLDLLTKASGSESSAVRRGAVGAMSHLGEEAAVDARVRLLELRDDGDAEVREQAESSLRTLAERHRPKSTSKEAVPLPVDDWDARLLDDKVLKACAQELGVEGLLSALQDGREFVRANAAAALGFSGKEGRAATPMLLLALKDSAQRVRGAAAGAIGRLKLPIDDVALAMLSALSRSGPEVGKAVSAALGRYGKAGVQAVVDAMADRQLDVEKSVEPVARARHEDFVGPLASALAVDSPLVRRNAVDVLAALGPHARDAEPALVERLDDQDFGVRLAAVRALGRLGDIDDKVVFRLMDIVRDDPNVSLVIAAKEAFRYLGLGWRIPG